MVAVLIKRIAIMIAVLIKIQKHSIFVIKRNAIMDESYKNSKTRYFFVRIEIMVTVL